MREQACNKARSCKNIPSSSLVLSLSVRCFRRRACVYKTLTLKASSPSRDEAVRCIWPSTRLQLAAELCIAALARVPQRSRRTFRWRCTGPLTGSHRPHTSAVAALSLHKQQHTYQIQHRCAMSSPTPEPTRFSGAVAETQQRRPAAPAAKRFVRQQVPPGPD